MPGTKRITAILAFILLCSTVSQAMSLMKSASQLRCQCITTHSAFISPRLFEKVELIPSGPHCKNVELIITLKTGETVCVNPSAPWVEKIIERILQSKQNQAEPEE
ncbi:interleukin-8-like [Spea bombifrons]|uniref:interleukin-8-like n=1 Tax=Spea bombifrons TaxID=233779 RepID=UPI00234B6223|nr:interleukin-8-like [Spea bombifrons]